LFCDNGRVAKRVAPRHEETRAAARLALEIVAGSAKLVYHPPQETPKLEAFQKTTGDNAMSAQLDHGYGNADGDYGDHLKTYKGFLNLLIYATGGSALTLTLMYFFLAR
jgi:hypothetical protein